jgi:hypothetical protein
VQLMLNAAWVYNGTNGDTSGGLIQGYGFGLMISTLAPN